MHKHKPSFEGFFCRGDNMKYIIASDYDGTLRIDNKISDTVIDAIKKFRSKGNLFGIVTGRSYDNGYEVFKGEEIPFDFIVMCGGSSACDKDGNILFANYVNGDIADRYVKRCFELTKSPCGITNEKMYYRFHPDLPDGGVINGREYVVHKKAKEIKTFVMANAICDTAEDAAKVVEVLKSEFGEYLNPQQNGRCIDCPPVGVNKATGLEQLAKVLGMDKENIYTVGDNYNDLDMLKAFKSCAIRTGVEEIRKYADYICDDVADVVSIVLGKSK